MLLRRAVPAVALVMAALGGAPQRTTRVNGRSMPPPHTHDPSRDDLAQDEEHCLYLTNTN